jgi:hypothetical protein
VNIVSGARPFAEAGDRRAVEAGETVSLNDVQLLEGSTVARGGSTSVY